MHRYLPLTAVLLAFWIGRETAAQKPDMRNRELRLDKLIVDEIELTGSLKAGPHRTGKLNQNAVTRCTDDVTAKFLDGWVPKLNTMRPHRRQCAGLIHTHQA